MNQFYLFLFLLITILACKENENPDLIVYNAVVYTADSTNPIAEAFAIKKGKIVEVGHYEDIIKHKNNRVELLDAKGKFIMPGLNEGHAHFLSLGKSLLQLDLLDVKSWEELLQKVKMAVDTMPKGTWVEGRGWHQDKWDKKILKTYNGYPYHDDLSNISPDHPVVLYHASGHALLANENAMHLSGINPDSESPKGGRIVKDPSGKIIGIFEENAMDIVSENLKSYQSKLPDSVQRMYKEKQLNLACHEALKYGITSLQDAGSSLQDIDWLYQMSTSGKIPIRLNVMLYEDSQNILSIMDSLRDRSYNSEWFRAKSIKAYMDGALGSYGAWLWEDYSDNPGNKGQTLISLDQMFQLADKAKRLNLQMCVHAIGDRANHEVLNIFKKNSVNATDRWRIEHAQHLDPKDITLFKEMGIIASMQAIHCISDAPFVEKRLGSERAASGAYIWRKLLDQRVHFANGTDAPVERINPFECIYASVTRKRIDSGFEFYPNQKMTRDEALRSYTIWNAYASYEDSNKGSITSGKLADFIILNRNLLTCTDEEILNAEVEAVFINGERIR
ncbi:MAG: amidohydrolase [Saprospiraceae bacterium]|nr:amidohydrolase [Saprospiraceae bacterium]